MTQTQRLKQSAGDEVKSKPGPSPLTGFLAAAVGYQHQRLSKIPLASGSSKQPRCTRGFHSAGHGIAPGTPADLQDRLKGSAPVCSPQAWAPGGWYLPSLHSEQQRHLCSHLSPPLPPWASVPSSIKQGRETRPWYSKVVIHPTLRCWFTTR